MAFELNRRSFLATGTAGAALIGLPGTLRAQESTPKVGGSLRIGHSGGATSDTLDPATFAAGPVVTAMLAICNNLMEIDEEGQAIPELAQSFEPSADAKTWTATLRPDAVFSNGQKLRAADVIASYNHHRGEETKSGAKDLLKQIAEMRADGDGTVVFELTGPNADFPFVAADYHLVIQPDQGDGTIDWANPVGTGGYVLEDHEPGVRLNLRRRDDYWKADRAWFEDVELRTINDPTARQNALVTGEVDAINGVDTKTVHLLSRRPGIQLIETVSSSHFPMPMMCDTAPFDDNNVRMALKHAINREELVEKVLRGHGAVGNDQPIGPAYRFHDPDLEQRVYDPDRARHYLKEAGQENLKVTLHTSNAPHSGGVDMAILFKEHAAAAGIEIDVRREPEDGYWSNVWLKKPFCQSYWNGRPTADWMFTMVYAAGAEWNESRWTNERFNELLLQARAELDQGKRAEMYAEMQRIVRDDSGEIIPMFGNFIDGANDKVAHGKVAPNRFLDGWKCVERWWAA
ncbi:ABC transporter substrate-binding protein [Jannaschia rubra]|uniref:Dipeptide-binding protein n=1 Tax=Jannaschia rubra TaxID=282197 RepID=A0A0M6XP53_9RHOB|nr:ABC transporter substrate-binding protein [Jannaschia rubra]CTQ32668.1 Dipeptide-binding protein [Jannaschia rubra]SFF87086.1 peptide/nickel transport system substrate-binding protein [Jannaschia rubra]